VIEQERAVYRRGYENGYKAGVRASSHAAVRWTPDGYEMRCSLCREWWPLDADHWQPRHGMRRCLSCQRAYKAAKMAGYREDAAVREARLERSRLAYRIDAPRQRARLRAWRAANREKVAEYNRRYRERHAERLRAKTRAYYAECRPVILAKKRAAYAGEVA